MWRRRRKYKTAGQAAAKETSFKSLSWQHFYEKWMALPPSTGTMKSKVGVGRPACARITTGKHLQRTAKTSHHEIVQS